MKKLPLQNYIEWCDHPVTKELRRICREIVEQDSSNFFECISDKDNPEGIALKASEIRGRNRVLRRFYEETLIDEKNYEYKIKDFFERNGIDWEA